MTDSENTFAMYKEVTGTHRSQSLVTLTSIVIINSIWQFVAFAYILAVRKATKISHQPHNDIPQLVDVASSVFREYLIQDYRRSGPSTNNR